MLPSIMIVDNFCQNIMAVRQSALDSGFGKWTPNKGLFGSSIYTGMNYTGKHSFMLLALAQHMGQAVFPNSMFFRVSNKDTEGAYVHSDRNDGEWTCVAYLSDHKEESGTGFFRHRATGLMEMPPICDLKGNKRLMNRLGKDMISGTSKEWEKLDFVRGLFNRSVIFRAPLFHSRWPKHGIGTTEVDGRMIWGCHFNLVPQT